MVSNRELFLQQQEKENYEQHLSNRERLLIDN